MVEEPEDAGGPVLRFGRNWRVAIGENNQAIVVAVFVDVGQHGGKAGAAPPQDFHSTPRPFQGEWFAFDFYVKLDHIDLLDAIAEKLVDERKAPLQVGAGNRATDIDGKEQLGGKVAATAHILKAIAPAGFHARQHAIGRQDRGAELAQDRPIIQLGFERRQEPFAQLAGDAAPTVAGLGDPNHLVDPLVEERVFVPILRVFQKYF